MPLISDVAPSSAPTKYIASTRRRPPKTAHGSRSRTGMAIAPFAGVKVAVVIVNSVELIPRIVRSELRVEAHRAERGRASLRIVGGIGDELIVQTQLDRRGQGEAVIGLEDLL